MRLGKGKFSGLGLRSEGYNQSVPLAKLARSRPPPPSPSFPPYPHSLSLYFFPSLSLRVKPLPPPTRFHSLSLRGPSFYHTPLPARSLPPYTPHSTATNLPHHPPDLLSCPQLEKAQAELADLRLAAAKAASAAATSVQPRPTPACVCTA